MKKMFTIEKRGTKEHVCSNVFDETIQISTNYIEKTQTLKCLICKKILSYSENIIEEFKPWGEIRKIKNESDESDYVITQIS